MNFVPYTVARYGIYAACAVAVLSILIGRQAGASFDFLLLRSIAVFVIVTALALGAEAVLSFEGPGALPAGPPAPDATATATSSESTTESSTE